MIDLDEIVLPDDLQPLSPGSYPESPNAVLLTGATGYYGAYALVELLTRTRADIHCLVRASDAAAGRARLCANLARYGLAAAADSPRVQIVPGRVDAPRLGIDPAAYTDLADRLDAIYHLAAGVSFGPDYAELHATNVAGLGELLRLAATGRAKPVHLVSSYSVGNERQFDGGGTVPEAPLTGRGAGFMHGYPASKWAAERYADLARARGFDIAIYRAGLIWGDTRTGRCKPDEIIVLNLLACRALGIAQDMDMLLHLTPVDYCAQALVALSLRPTAVGAHYHLIADPPIAWRDLVAWFAARGDTLRFVPPAEWFARFKPWLRTNRDWLPLYWLLSRDPTRSLWRHANMFSLRYETAQTRAALMGTGVTPPPIDDTLLQTYRRAFAEILLPRA